MNRLTTFLRVAVAILLIVAGLSKVADLEQFSEAIQNYRLISPLTSALLACYLPFLEIICGLALFFPGYRAAGLFAICPFVIAFFLALWSAAVRRLNIDCGCFGGPLGSPTVFHELITVLFLNFVIVGLLVCELREPLPRKAL
jgi:putative oxidoreductase